MRRLALLAALGLLAACGSTAQPTGVATGDGGLVAPGVTTPGAVAAPDGATSDPGSTESTATPTTRPGAGPGSSGTPSAAPAPVAAGARVTEPITIGFLNTVVGNAQALGLNAGETYSQRQVIDALVEAINEDGGLAGRQVDAIHAETDTASTNWEVSFAAACERFTRDNSVEAVLGYSFVLLDSFEQCLTDAGVVHVNAGYNLGDVQTFEEHPLLVGTTAVTADRRYVLQLQGAVDAGVLTPEHKVGLLRDDCPYSLRAHERSTLPYIERAGIDVVAEATIGCAQGAGDAGAIAGQIQNAVLQFRSRGVDTVVIEGVPIVIFAQNAESQSWHPRYLLTSGGAAIEPNVPRGQAENMYGFGVFAPIDVNPSQQPPLTPGAERCLGLLARKNIVPKQYNDFVNAYTACDALFLYETALDATGGSSDSAGVLGAITALGERYVGVSGLEGRTSFSAERRDGPSRYRQWGWIDDCSCFQYIGPALPF